MNDTPEQSETTDTAESKLDQLVEQSSVPSLATLIQRGKEQGLIKPTVAYANA